MVNQRPFSGLAVLFSPLHPPLPPFSVCFFFFSFSPYLQAITLTPLTSEISLCFLFTFSRAFFLFFFFFLLALPKGLIWKYHILTGENTLLADLFAVTASFLKQSSREEIFVFQRRKKMSCSASVKDNELSLSLTVKPLEKYNRP